MENEFETETVAHELGRIAGEVKEDVNGRGGFYLRSCLRQVRDIRDKGRKVLINWVRANAERLGETVEKSLWVVHRPLCRLAERLDAMEKKQENRLKLGEQEKQETDLEADELARMADEGGIVPPPSIPASDHARGASEARFPIASSLR